MTTRTAPRPSRAAGAGAAGPREPRSFHTPVRGHRFAVRPVGSAPLGCEPLRLRLDPDNPADPYAIAVWVDGGGRPWRIGYLERAVAVRIAPLLRAGHRPSVHFAGWWEEPQGRWRRPVVRLFGEDDRGELVPRGGLRSLPPHSTSRRAPRTTETRPGR